MGLTSDEHSKVQTVSVLFSKLRETLLTSVIERDGDFACAVRSHPFSATATDAKIRSCTHASALKEHCDLSLLTTRCKIYSMLAFVVSTCLRLCESE